MKISGFSFARNTVKLYYPIAESIRSILPVCDEFVIAVGRGDEDDTTRAAVESIGDPKIRIIDTVWSDTLENKVLAEQTNIALDACTGDWCFYIHGLSFHLHVTGRTHPPVMKHPGVFFLINI